jgi:hypothetical protein
MEFRQRIEGWYNQSTSILILIRRRLCYLSKDVIQHKLLTIQYKLLKSVSFPLDSNSVSEIFFAQIGSKTERLVVQNRPPNYRQTEAGGWK